MEYKEVNIDNDIVCMKKGFDGWRVIYPIKNKDGSLNMKNLIIGGSWWSFIKMLFIFFLLIMAIVIYHYDTQTCQNTLKHIDEVCIALQKGNENPYNPKSITNLSVYVKP